MPRVQSQKVQLLPERFVVLLYQEVGPLPTKNLGGTGELHRCTWMICKKREKEIRAIENARLLLGRIRVRAADSPVEDNVEH